MDGVPVELWKSLADQRKDADNRGEPEKRCNIAWILTQVYNDIETYGTDLTTGFSEGCMTPIYKKKNPDDIANYRPITLLNTDYKIFTKAISMKLADAVPEVIHRDQAGFMKGRSIFDQVKTTKLVIDYMERTKTKGAIVALDQEKAYDKIIHNYLWAVLRKFEFPENFINTMASLYEGAVTKVMINGELSPPYPITRGVRQGDPLSCLLFDLAIEPLAQSIRKAAELKGIPIPGRRDSLKIKLFADDTTVYMSGEDKMEDLQRILDQWCTISGAKFNIEKTEIIPVGDEEQRREIRESGRLSEWGQPLPQDTHIAKDGEPVRILGAWLGNGIDQATTWAPIMENCSRRLQRWNAGKHSLEGRRLILQMQVAGVTQYLTRVQGMPSAMEAELNKQIRHFMWNHEKADTVNQAQMYAPHGRGGKKILDIETRNKAIHLIWLKAYLNLGEDRATWTYFADAIIGTDIPSDQKVDEDPESRVMPFLQTWRTRGRYSTLPEDLRIMLKLAKEYNVQLEARNPSQQAKEEMPMWYHTKAVASARRSYKTKPAKCLRRKHGIRLVRDATALIARIGEEHSPRINCNCDVCHNLRTSDKCTHPFKCLTMAVQLLSKISPEWNPTNNSPAVIERAEGDEENLDEEDVLVEKSAGTQSLVECITIFGEKRTEETGRQEPADAQNGDPAGITTVYMDGACLENGTANAIVGSGVWYGRNDPRNMSTRVPLATQSNQTGELMAVLLAVKNHDPHGDLRLISDSRYVIEGLTKHLHRWEQRGWTGVTNGNIFKIIIAWIRWRRGRTYLRWTRGHNGTLGNEEADRLAGEGARLPDAPDEESPAPPPGKQSPGASLAKLEQRDFYRILRDKRKLPPRRTSDLNVEMVQEALQETYSVKPTIERVWLATKHRDLARKVRDFLWKSTQGTYKIGSYWTNIDGYQDRAICTSCNEREDMDHILLKCRTGARETAWDLANTVWTKRSQTEIPTTLGNILGCGLATFETGGKQDKGKGRLYRIIVSETAYLIWKLRNERRIRDNDSPPQSANKVRNRWTNTMNKRLTLDRLLTNAARFQSNAIEDKPVKATWTNCLKEEESLPANWPTAKGVLVGILATRPLEDPG